MLSAVRSVIFAVSAVGLVSAADPPAASKAAPSPKPVPISAPNAAAFEKAVSPVLAHTCTPCHNSQVASGGFDADAFLAPSSILEQRDGWDHILMKLRSGEMPPKGIPKPQAEIDTLVGELHYGTTRIAHGTMGYKHKQADLAAVKASMAASNFLLKIIPHVDGTPRICEIVEYHLTDVDLKGAWTGPAALELYSHALAPLAELPVLEVVSATHILADLTLGLGKVVHDYLA